MERLVRKAKTVQLVFRGSDPGSETRVSGMLSLAEENKVLLLLDGMFAGSPLSLSITCDGTTGRVAWSMAPQPVFAPAPPDTREEYLGKWLRSGVMSFLPKVTAVVPGEGSTKSPVKQENIQRIRGPNAVENGRELVSVQYLCEGEPGLTIWIDRSRGLPVRRELRLPGRPGSAWIETYENLRLDEPVDPALFTLPKD